LHKSAIFNGYDLILSPAMDVGDNPAPNK